MLSKRKIHFTKLLPSKLRLRYRIARNICLILVCCFLLQDGIQSWIRYFLQPPLYLEEFTIDDKIEDNGKKTLGTEDIDIQMILKENIFGGKVEGPQKSTEDKGVDLDKIPLAKNIKELNLIGTIVSSDQQNMAIIDDKGDRDPPRIVKQGDRIKKILLKIILRNNVVLGIGDQEKVLSIDYKARNLLDKKSGSQQKDLIPKVKKQTFSIERDYVLQSLSNIRDLFQEVRIMPYMKEGKPQGYQVDNIKEKSFFNQIHLQNGDVLIKAENQPLTSVQQVWGLANRLQSKDQVTLQVLRNNRKITYQYNLK